ncbi:MAG: ATP-grasp domain-containing protein [Dehalococcoidales bacterium]|nr:ATP-grasp domain-containing protein [Dehalococcoidales bacterium]
MPKSIAIVYNTLHSSYYDKHQEAKAVSGVLTCVNAVHKALTKLGYNAKVIPLSPGEHVRDILSSLDASLVFNLFEGFPGEPETEIIVPEILSKRGVPFTGCTAAVLKLGLDKFNLKKMLRTAGIPTPDFQLLGIDKIHLFRLNFPCIVKPCREDGSHGISPESVVHDSVSLKQRVKMILDDYNNQALVEEFVNGREFNVTVMGDTKPEVLPVSEIVYTLPPEMPQLLTFEAKWEPESLYYQNTKAECPAKINDKARESIQKTALGVYRLLGCSGYARVDMRMDNEGKLNVIEMNPNPDISPDAGVTRQAAAAGLDYERLIEKIIKLALDRKKYEFENTSRISFRQNRFN